jgi:hypothetical protein
LATEGLRALVDAWERGDCPLLRALNLSCTGNTSEQELRGARSVRGARGTTETRESESERLTRSATRAVIDLVAAWRAGGSPDLRNLRLCSVRDE